MKTNDISVIVTTQNDASSLDRCLGSVADFAEVIVVDAFSSDDTVKIARSHGAIIFSRTLRSAAAQKNWTMGRVRRRWILSLDAVDALSVELRRAIEGIEENSAYAGYDVRRANYYLGRRIRYCGWEGSNSVRLFDRSRGRFVPLGMGPDAGTSIEIDGEITSIHGQLDYFPFETIEDHIDAVEAESTLRARSYVEGGGRLPVLGMVFRPPASFLRDYVLGWGFRDGIRGFVFCLIGSYGVFLACAKAWELLWKKTIR